MWSGPRNLSTAMMRSWENRPDTEVMDEPLYAHYLAATGLEHPMAAEIIAAGPSDPDRAIAHCLAAPVDQPISYQKHMAHHLLDGMDRSWLDEFTHILLIRHPGRVMASYQRKRDTVELADLGVAQQVELLERFGSDLFIVDADDFLASPAHFLEGMCRVADVAYDDALGRRMTRWPPGPRSTDGVWAPHWYDAVVESTGFGPVPGRVPDPPSERSQRRVYDAALECYDTLFSRRTPP